MTLNDLDELAELVKRERDALLSRWRQQVRQLPSARKLDIPTLNDHIPGLLDELATALQSHSDQTIPEALGEDSSPAHGLQRVQDAFDIEEVVAEYNILRGCIHDLADENGLTLQGKPFSIINLVFDHAIGVALQTYATQRALEVQRHRAEYLAFVAHDLRTPLNAISLAARVLQLTLSQGGNHPETVQMLNA
jgi:two-component system phosphate regulon sensor histidine kinase PhoR